MWIVRVRLLVSRWSHSLDGRLHRGASAGGLALPPGRHACVTPITGEARSSEAVVQELAGRAWDSGRGHQAAW